MASSTQQRAAPVNSKDMWAARRGAFRALHERGRFVIPNPWEAQKAFDLFVETFQAKYAKATECLAKDREVLLTFYDFPAEHWVHNFWLYLVKLPAEYIALLRIQNGGYTHGFSFPMTQRTTWAKMCLWMIDLAGIVTDPEIQTAQNLLDTADMMEEWGCRLGRPCCRAMAIGGSRWTIARAMFRPWPGSMSSAVRISK